MHQTLNIGAGERLEFYEDGDFFRLMAATAPISVEFYSQGREIAEAIDVGAGYAERFHERRFDRFAITSASAQTITVAARLGNEVSYDTPPNGSVTVTNTAGAFTHATTTVTTASAQIAAAKANRRYLLIQNHHATNDLWVRLDGGAAAVGSGIKVTGGGSLEVGSGYMPTGAITAYASAAATNAHVVEG